MGNIEKPQMRWDRGILNGLIRRLRVMRVFPIADFSTDVAGNLMSMNQLLRVA